jgi:hypothetical protein
MVNLFEYIQKKKYKKKLNQSEVTEKNFKSFS